MYVSCDIIPYSVGRMNVLCSTRMDCLPVHEVDAEMSFSELKHESPVELCHVFSPTPYKRFVSKTVSPMTKAVIPGFEKDEEEDDDNISIIGSSSDGTADAKSLWSIDGTTDIYVDKSVWSDSKATNRLKLAFVLQKIRWKATTQIECSSHAIHTKSSSSASSKLNSSSSSYPSATVISLDTISSDSGCTEIFYADEGAQAVLIRDELKHFENQDAELPSLYAAKAHVTCREVLETVDEGFDIFQLNESVTKNDVLDEVNLLEDYSLFDILDGLKLVNSDDESDDLNYSLSDICDGLMNVMQLSAEVSNSSQNVAGIETNTSVANLSLEDSSHCSSQEDSSEWFSSDAFLDITENGTQLNELVNLRNVPDYSLSNICDGLIDVMELSGEVSDHSQNVAEISTNTSVVSNRPLKSILKKTSDHLDNVSLMKTSSTRGLRRCDGLINVMKSSAEVSAKSQNVIGFVTNTSVVSNRPLKSILKKTCDHLDDVSDMMTNSTRGLRKSVVFKKANMSRVFETQSQPKTCRAGKGRDVKLSMKSHDGPRTSETMKACAHSRTEPVIFKKNISQGFENQSPAETCKVGKDLDVKLSTKENDGPSSPGKFQCFLRRAGKMISRLNPFNLFKTCRSASAD